MTAFIKLLPIGKKQLTLTGWQPLEDWQHLAACKMKQQKPANCIKLYQICLPL